MRLCGRGGDCCSSHMSFLWWSRTECARCRTWICEERERISSSCFHINLVDRASGKDLEDSRSRSCFPFPPLLHALSSRHHLLQRFAEPLVTRTFLCSSSIDKITIPFSVSRERLFKFFSWIRANRQAMAGTGTLEMQGGPARGSQDSPVGPPQQIPTASQLTIFYSGSVNVFHDVPADKAHAIMLLLASGDEKRNRITDGSTMPGASSLEFPAINNRASIPRSFNAPSANLKPPFSGASTPPPSSPFQAPQPEKKPTQLISRRTQAELPFARKASLARFLEKRKDRVQVNAGACSDEGFPDIASKKLKTCDDGIAQSE